MLLFVKHTAVFFLYMILQLAEQGVRVCQKKLVHNFTGAEKYPVFVVEANILHLSSGEPLTVEPYQSSLQDTVQTHTQAEYLKPLITASSCFYSHWQVLLHYNAKNFICIRLLLTK